LALGGCAEIMVDKGGGCACVGVPAAAATGTRVAAPLSHVDTLSLETLFGRYTFPLDTTLDHHTIT